MRIAAEEHIAVGRWLQGKDYPDCWDSPSFAHNLCGAFEGFLGQDKMKGAGAKLKQKIAQDNEGVYPPPGGEFFSSAVALQKVAYTTLFNEIFPVNHLAELQILCAERCAAMFLPYDIFDGEGSPASNGVFTAAFALLKGKTLPSPVRIKVVKTWLNGWATSHRFHEDEIHDCLLGCKGEKDSLTHYVNCPHIYAMLRFLFVDISEDPSVRMEIKAPEIFSFKVISCLFSAYHALKSEVRSGKINMHYQTWLQSAWSVFANVCKAEAGELGVSTRAFSLVKFIDFLITGRLPSPANNSPLHDHIET